jgi:hypothetical protein
MGLIRYKITGPNGVAFYDGMTRYVVGETLEHPSPDLSNAACGKGFHVSEHLHQARSFVSADLRQAHKALDGDQQSGWIYM